MGETEGAKMDRRNNFNKRGLTEELVREISELKKEPEWALELRLRGLKAWNELEMPKWAPKVFKKGGSEGLINVDEIEMYVKPEKETVKSWKEVPKEIRKTFDELGIPEAEREQLAGVGAQYDSEMVYQHLRSEIEKDGVVYLPMDEAINLTWVLEGGEVGENWEKPTFKGGNSAILAKDEKSDGVSKKFVQEQQRKNQEYLEKFGVNLAELIQEKFMKLVPPEDHKVQGLHAAAHSGGSFIYVPKNKFVTVPLQSYYRLNAPGVGQFEHTLIIVDEGAELHFIEGCSAPKYSMANLHAGCVEIYVGKNAKVKFSTVENWSKNMFNLSTKRAWVEEGGEIQWVTGSFGANTTMIYPMGILVGRGAKMTYTGVSFASGLDDKKSVQSARPLKKLSKKVNDKRNGQIIDSGAKAVLMAPETSVVMNSKALSQNGGKTMSRMLAKVLPEARGAKVYMNCKSLILTDDATAESIPEVKVKCKEAEVAHEASVGKISDEAIEYLASRGISEEKATELIVRGFVGEIVRELPVEYAMEMNNLIKFEMKNG